MDIKKLNKDIVENIKQLEAQVDKSDSEESLDGEGKELNDQGES